VGDVRRLAALVALLFTWGVFLVVDPPEAGWIGPSFIVIATAMALIGFVRLRSDR